MARKCNRPFAAELFNPLTIKGRGIVTENQNQLIRVIGGINRLGFAFIEEIFFFHNGHQFVEMRSIKASEVLVGAGVISAASTTTLVI